MSLNQIRILALTLLAVGEALLALNGFIEAVILGAMLIISVLWLVSEQGTHASYTIRIGQMLEMLFKPRPKPQPNQVISNEGLQITNEKAHSKLYKLEDGEELTNGNDKNPDDYMGMTGGMANPSGDLIKDEQVDGGVNNPDAGNTPSS